MRTDPRSAFVSSAAGRLTSFVTPMKRLLAVLVFAFCLTAPLVHGAEKKIILIAGKPSHPPGMHEFHAGALLLQQCLANTPGVKVIVYANGWPDVATAFEGADAVVIYSDGGAKN